MAPPCGSKTGSTAARCARPAKWSVVSFERRLLSPSSRRQSQPASDHPASARALIRVPTASHNRRRRACRDHGEDVAIAIGVIRHQPFRGTGRALSRQPQQTSSLLTPAMRRRIENALDLGSFSAGIPAPPSRDRNSASAVAAGDSSRRVGSAAAPGAREFRIERRDRSATWRDCVFAIARMSMSASQRRLGDDADGRARSSIREAAHDLPSRSIG